MSDYIGGTPKEARIKYFLKNPDLLSTITEISNRYGLDPSLVAYRLSKEGIIDSKIKAYNKGVSTEKVNGITLDAADDAFHGFGTDWLAHRIKSGNVKLERVIPFTEEIIPNEKGENSHPAHFFTNYDNIEGMAALLRTVKDEVLKDFAGLHIDLNAAIMAYYNRGRSGGRNYIRNNTQWNSEYKVPEEFKLLFLNIKPSKTPVIHYGNSEGVTYYYNYLKNKKYNIPPALQSSRKFWDLVNIPTLEEQKYINKLRNNDFVDYLGITENQADSIMNAATKPNYFILQKQNGGTMNNFNTQDSFITSKLEEIRKNALDASRKKTNTTILDIEKVYGKKFVKEVLQGYVNDALEKLNALRKQESERVKRSTNPEFISPNVNRPIDNYRLYEAEKSLEEAKKMLNGEIPYTPYQLSNCIANLSEFFPHGLPSGNETFKSNPSKYGFKMVHPEDVQPGDVVLVIDKKGKPFHALLYNGVDKNGTPTFNYSDGRNPYSNASKSVSGRGYGINKHYPDIVSKDNTLNENALVYRYVGTPQDSMQWTNEWLQMQNKEIFKSGGKMNYLNYFKKGGIHIKPENRGKFTKSAKAAGEGVQEHAHKVMNDPNATTLLRRRAQFAINSKKWNHKKKHSEGGIINYLNFFE